MYKEFDKCLEEAKKGSQIAKVKIVEMLDPLLKSSIKKYCPLYEHYHDLYQDGVLIILNCIKTHKQARGNILAYIKSYLKYHYLTSYDYLKNQNTISSQDDQEEDRISQIADITNIEEDYLKKEESRSLNKKLEKLTVRQMEVIKLYYFYKMPIKDIAEKLKISSWTVVHTKKRAIENLRRKYDNKQNANSL